MKTEWLRYALVLAVGIVLGCAATAFAAHDKAVWVKTLDRADTFALAGGKARAHLILNQDTGASRASMGYLDGKVGFVVPPHKHAGSAELLWFVKGTGELTIGGAKYEVGPQTAIYIPEGTLHSFRATSDFEAVQVYAAPGPEQRFRKVGEPVRR